MKGGDDLWSISILASPNMVFIARNVGYMMVRIEWTGVLVHFHCLVRTKGVIHPVLDI